MRSLALLLVAFTGCITEPNLSIVKTGTGEGRIVSEPADIDCGEKCGAIVYGPLTLTALPDAASTFVGWTGGGCSGTEPCLLDLGADTIVEAAFDEAPVTLSITTNGSGSVSGSGIDCGETCSAQYTAGTLVQLTARAGEGYKFAAWSDGNSGVIRTIELTESRTLGATFTAN